MLFQVFLYSAVSADKSDDAFEHISVQKGSLLALMDSNSGENSFFSVKEGELEHMKSSFFFTKDGEASYPRNISSKPTSFDLSKFSCNNVYVQYKKHDAQLVHDEFGGRYCYVFPTTKYTKYTIDSSAKVHFFENYVNWDSTTSALGTSAVIIADQPLKIDNQELSKSSFIYNSAMVFLDQSYELFIALCVVALFVFLGYKVVGDVCKDGYKEISSVQSEVEPQASPYLSGNEL